MHVEFFNVSGDEQKLEKFRVNRERYVKQLRSQIEQLEARKEDAMKSMDKITKDVFMVLGKSVFDDQEKNMDMRKLVFLHRSIQNTELELSNQCYSCYL